MPTSLYQLWQQQVAAHPGTTALIDAVAGESFTFAELDADLGPALPRPTGNTPSFIRQTLAAWRDGIASIPIEQGSAGPPDGFELPRGTAHVKTTSGSTGTPRYVCFTAAQLAAEQLHEPGPDRRPHVGTARFEELVEAGRERPGGAQQCDRGRPERLHPQWAPGTSGHGDGEQGQRMIKKCAQRPAAVDSPALAMRPKKHDKPL